MIENSCNLFENIDPASARAYVEILEKTNQQLSLWTNPYGLMVGGLGVMVAVLAIGFAYVLWKQGREYKGAVEAFFKEQKQLVNEEMKKTIKEAKDVLDGEIKKLRKEAQSAEGDKRDKLLERVRGLERRYTQLDSLGALHLNSSINDFGSIGNIYTPTRNVDCPHCGKTFEAPSNNIFGSTTRVTSVSLGRNCPHCGNWISEIS